MRTSDDIAKMPMAIAAASPNASAARSTQDVDRAYDVMNLANEHIEQGDYDVWFDEYKRKEADIYG